MPRRVLTFLILLAAIPVPAADSPEAFRASLVRALRAHDVRTVESLFAIPWRTMETARRDVGIVTRSGPSGLPEGLFWPDTICAIERGAIHDSGDRVTFGDSNLVASRSNGELKAISFKTAGGPYEAKKRPLASLDLRIRGAKRQAAGNLEFDEVDVYEIDMIKNVVLQATLERFPGNLAVFRVTDTKGKPVNAAADGRRSWTGTIPETGTYRVEVVRKAAYCDPLITYLLTLTAR